MGAITPFKVQGHSMSPSLVPVERCNFLLVINTNLPAILHRVRDIAFDKSLYSATPLSFTPSPAMEEFF